MSNTTSLQLPFTYPDLVCLDDLDPLATQTTSDLQNLSQDVYHVLLELFGTNPDDSERGLGVETYLSGTINQLQTLPGICEEQINQDPRVSNSVCQLSQNDDGSIGISVTVQVGAAVLGVQAVFTTQGSLAFSGVTGI